MSGRPYAEVIGDPVAHSKSPTIHNFWLGKLRIDAEYRACHVRADELAEYLEQRRWDELWRGCNVTMPHKRAVMDHLDRTESDAQRIGAINTIVSRYNELEGFNTDSAGFLEPLKPFMTGQGFRFGYVIGTGGAARAIVDALYHERFLIFSISRNREKARQELFDYVGRDEDFLWELDQLEHGASRPADPDVLSVWVNATPLGMTGYPELKIGWGPLFENSIVYDIVTSPADTEFLLQAQQKGMRTIDGLAMLIGQAAVAFEKFFGRYPPREFDAELRALLTA